MKKRWVAGAAAWIALSVTTPALAGTWVQDPTKPANENGVSNWWYRNDDGSYPANCWAWLDGNQDGLAESYRFNENGWMYASTRVDEYDVDASGAWTINGEVVRRNVNQQAAQVDLAKKGFQRELAMQCFDLINEERKKEGLQPLVYNETLMNGCIIRAEEITQSFSHTRPNGNRFHTVVSSQALGGDPIHHLGENIAAGYRSPAEAVQGWMGSEGHRANILRDSYTEAAVGCYIDADSEYKVYWVQIFYQP